VIKTIKIKGFECPLIVEDGKRIKNWTNGLRERLREEAPNLPKIANPPVQQSPSLLSNDISESFPETEESDNEWENWEWFSRDGEALVMESDSFLAMNDDSWVSEYESLPPE
jgi:hypothetical protein